MTKNIYFPDVLFHIGEFPIGSYLKADMEIMVYLGIIDTIKYIGSQKILTEITAILSLLLLWCEKCGYFVVKMALWEICCPKIFHIKIKIKQCFLPIFTVPHRILHIYVYLILRLWVPRFRNRDKTCARAFMHGSAWNLKLKFTT